MTRLTVYIGTALLMATVGLSLSSAASAEEVTRASYRESVEPICQRDAQANERILAGVRRLVRRGRLKPAARQFVKAASALDRAIAELRALPQPSADRELLGRWLSRVEEEASLFRSAARKLRAGNRAAAQSDVAKLTNNATLANSSVAAFEFHYCRLEPSRYT